MLAAWTSDLDEVAPDHRLHVGVDPGVELVDALTRDGVAYEGRADPTVFESESDGRLHRRVFGRRRDTGGRVDCPMQMMVGALGACIALTLDAVAKHKGIALTDFEARLDYFTDGNGTTKFDVVLQLGPELSDRERKILYQSAKLCEVGKILKSNIEIDCRVCDSTSPI